MANRNYKEEESKEVEARQNNKPRRSRNKNRAVKNKDCNANKSESNSRNTNDIAWYSKNSDLVNLACSIPFGYPNGVNLHTVATVPDQNRNAINTMGGIMVMDIIHTPGIVPTNAPAGSNVMDIAARDIYAWVRHANSGSSNYDPADLMTYLLAMDELFIWHTNLRRLYGCAYLFNPENRFVGKQLLTSLGFDADDIITHLPELNYHLNALAARINSFYVPASFPLYQRHAFLFSGLFMDSSNLQSQIYAMKPVGYRAYVTQFDNEANPPFGYLQWHWLIQKTVPANETTPKDYGFYKLTFADIKNISDYLINQIRVNEDMGIISGDIKKAYGNELFIVDTTPLDYVAPISTDISILNQLSNATALGQFDWQVETYGTNTKIHTLSVWQDPSQEGAGKIICNPRGKTNAAITKDSIIFDNRLLNLKDMDGSPNNVMYTTRLMVIPELGYDGDNTNITFQCSGSEIPGAIHVYYGSTDEFFHSVIKYELGVETTSTGDITNLGTLSAASILSSFRFAPRVCPYIGYTSNSKAKRHYMSFMDAELYARIDKRMLQNMHDTALLSLWNVPNRG